MCYEPIVAVPAAVQYRGLVNVELSRDSHRAPEVPRAALQYLKMAETKAAGAFGTGAND